MQRLSFPQTTDIVESRVEGETSTAIALHTSAWLHPLFQHKYLSAATCQNISALQSAETSAYDNYVILHAFLPFLFIHSHTAGCITYDNTTADTSPTSVEKPTDLMAGCLAMSMELTVVIRMTALKKIAVLW